MDSAEEQENLADTEGFQDPRWISLRPSRLGLALLGLGTLVALGAWIWVASRPFISWSWLTAVAVLVVVIAGKGAKRLLMKGRDASLAFYLVDLGSPGRGDSAKLGVRLRQAGSKAVADGFVVPGSFVTPLFTIIAYRLPDDARWRPARMLPLWKDSLDAESFRQTRVRLRWH